MLIYIKNSQRSKKLNKYRIKREITKALSHLGLYSAELSVLFVNNRRMRHLNAKYRGISRTTDVLSFPMAGSDFNDVGTVLGDIVVCVPRAAKQAGDFEVTFYDEVLRLLIHGLLHLLGFDHEISAYQKNKMRKKEKELLNAIKTMA